MTANAAERHEDNGAGYCAFCDELLTSGNTTAYCPGKGYYTTTTPRGLKSVSAWKKLGYKVRKDQRPAGEVYAYSLPSDRRWYAVYSFFQVEKVDKKVKV